VIDAVRAVTHIAPADAAGRIIGTPLQQARSRARPPHYLPHTLRPAATMRLDLSGLLLESLTGKC
jgi:hypothetical protein